MGQTYDYDDKPRISGGRLEDVEQRFDYDDRALLFDLHSNNDEFKLDANLSCVNGLTRGQKESFGLALAGIGIAGLFYPDLVLSGAASIFWILFSVMILWRLALITAGLICWIWRSHATVVRTDDLPVYTVMVAAYDEANVMRQLARALGALDWPADKLDILILLEEDDAKTLPAALKAGFPLGTRIITVPDGLPRTKPRALNYGLARAQGDYVCIYDVEDRPHPAQLKEAYEAFSRSGSDVVCLQAPLIGANAGKAWLAAHWSLEYAVQFRFLLPALAAIDAPIPIGGTSNHFDKKRLIAAGGWDAFNVTEDADLGLRFARLGWQVKTISNGTLEDAPTRFRDWKAQRTRWIKGFIQTWLVLMRRPTRTIKQMGVRNFVMMQLTLGGAVLAPLAHGPLFLLVVASLLIDQLSPGAAGWALLMTGWSVTLFSDLIAPGLPLKARLVAAFTRSVYWPMHSLAAWTALYEMRVKPHYWAKTPHVPSEDDTAECYTGSLH
ncbi:MAG: glycosyltransferase [Pseudomonadota bacterium]